MKVFEVVSKSECGFEAVVGRLENIQRPGACCVCSTLPKDCGPPAMLPVHVGSTADVLSFTSWGFGVIAVDFLELLEKCDAGCLKLGKLTDPDGNVIERFRTFVGSERIVLRGSSESQHRICPSCGALLYTYLPRGSPYVTAFQVASGRAAYEIESMQLLVGENIRERIGDRWCDLISFYEVPIVTSPIDGLPCNIGLWPIADQLANYQLHFPNRTQF